MFLGSVREGRVVERVAALLKKELDKVNVQYQVFGKF